MKAEIEMRDLNISLLTEDDFPAVLSHGGLSGLGVFPSDWKLAEEPTVPQFLSSFSFENGISFFASANEVQFSENISDKGPDKILLPDIVCKFVKVSSQTACEGVRIAFRGHAEVDSKEEAENFLLRRLLGNGPWTTSTPPVSDAQFHLAYQLEGRRCNLRVFQSVVNPGEGEELAAVLFFAGFDYVVDPAKQEQSTEAVISIIEKWREDMTFYQTTVNSQFLKPEAAR